MADNSRAGDYRAAYDEWQAQLQRLHEFFLEGKRLDPLQIKGLLNREARAKARYDRARLALLGIEEEAAPDDEEDGATGE